MKKYFDRFVKEITTGMMLVYEWSDGAACFVGPVVEQGEDLGVLDDYTSEFIPLSTTDLPHVRIKD